MEDNPVYTICNILSQTMKDINDKIDPTICITTLLITTSMEFTLLYQSNIMDCSKDIKTLCDKYYNNNFHKPCFINHIINLLEINDIKNTFISKMKSVCLNIIDNSDNDLSQIKPYICKEIKETDLNYKNLILDFYTNSIMDDDILKIIKIQKLVIYNRYFKNLDHKSLINLLNNDFNVYDINGLSLNKYTYNGLKRALIKYDLNWYKECRNDISFITGDKWNSTDYYNNMIVMIKCKDDNKYFCYYREEFKQHFETLTYEEDLVKTKYYHQNIMRNWILDTNNKRGYIDNAGFGGKAGKDKYYKLIYPIHYIDEDSYKLLMNGKNNKFILKLKSNNKIRIGNEVSNHGMGTNNGQLPGVFIYMLEIE